MFVTSLLSLAIAVTEPRLPPADLKCLGVGSGIWRGEWPHNASARGDADGKAPGLPWGRPPPGRRSAWWVCNRVWLSLPRWFCTSLCKAFPGSVCTAFIVSASLKHGPRETHGPWESGMASQPGLVGALVKGSCGTHGSWSGD